MNVTWTSSAPWRASCPCVWIAPLQSLLRVFLDARLSFCEIWMASQNPSFVPVLRRSCLFQENSATKRVSTMTCSRRQVINLTSWKKPLPFQIHFCNSCKMEYSEHDWEFLGRRIVSLYYRIHQTSLIGTFFHQCAFKIKICFSGERKCIFSIWHYSSTMLNKYFEQNWKSAVGMGTKLTITACLHKSSLERW